VLRSALICISLLPFFVQKLEAALEKPNLDAHVRTVNVRRVVLHSSVRLTPPERQKLLARLYGVWNLSQQQSPAEDTPEELVKDAYQDRGYCKVTVSSELVPLASLGGNSVGLVLDVTPGMRYRFVGISWHGISAFSQSELSSLFSIQVGEVFSRTKMAHGLALVHKLYLSHGYIDYTPLPSPQIDDDAANIAYSIDVNEGRQFRFGELEVSGMQEAHRRSLLSAWEGLRGQPFEIERADKFFNRFFRSPLPKVRPEDYARFKIDEDTGTVHYSLQLMPSLALAESRPWRF
jgi:hypothetical protein